MHRYTIKGNIDIQYRLRQTLQYFERTCTQYEHTENTIVGVHALMESIGTHIYLISISNNFLDVIICTHIYRIICQLARVFNRGGKPGLWGKPGLFRKVLLFSLLIQVDGILLCLSYKTLLFLNYYQ